jgi:hypoxanthine phosphoribosyltransferase
MRGDIERVLFDEPAINRRLDQLAQQISNDYRDRDLTVIAVLNGSVIFVADLLRRIPLPLKLDCVSAVSYHGKAQTSGEVIFKFATAKPSCSGQVALPDVVDRDVLIVDDILDSGHTLAAIRDKLETAKPRSIQVCVLLSKKKQRARRVDADYVGFEILDEFVVGYGLDSWNVIATFLTSACCEKISWGNRLNELVRDHGQSFEPRRARRTRRSTGCLAS